MAEQLRRYPPLGICQDELDRILDAIEAPRPRRTENELRAVFDPDASNPKAVSQAVVENVKELGLEPFKPPEPLSPIDEDEEALVCWLAVGGPVAE